jgi:integrase
MRGTSIFPQVVVLIATGLRRGELMGLQWCDLDLDEGRLRVERSIESMAAGLRVKGPKAAHGRRLIALPDVAVSVLRQHRKAILETRVALGIGRLPDDAFIFGDIAGKVRDPMELTEAWHRLIRAKSRCIASPSALCSNLWQ